MKLAIKGGYRVKGWGIEILKKSVSTVWGVWLWSWTLAEKASCTQTLYISAMHSSGSYRRL